MQSLKTVAALLFLAFFTASCSSSKPDEPKELKESHLKDSTTVSLDTPEQTMLDKAKQYYDTGLYSLAKEHFTALRTAYPNSQWTDFAEIKLADCMFESEEFPDAAKAYQDYVKNRPTSEAAPYMLFRAARSNQLAYQGIGRDPAPLNQALEQYNQLISTYPDSPYVESGKKFRSDVVNALVKHEKAIEHFYEKQDITKAAEAREKVIAEQWLPVVKQTAYTDSNQTQSAPEGTSPPPAPRVDESRERAARAPVQTITAAGRIVKIECASGGTHGVFVYFDHAVPLLDAYRKSQRVISQDGELTVNLSGVISPAQTSDCFGKKDLTLRTDGTITVASSKDGTAMSLANPPRLFIAVP